MRKGAGRVQGGDSDPVQGYELPAVRAQQSERVRAARAAGHRALHEDEREVAGHRDGAGDGGAGHDVQEEVRFHAARSLRTTDPRYYSRRSQVGERHDG